MRTEDGIARKKKKAYERRNGFDDRIEFGRELTQRLLEGSLIVGD